MVRTGIPDTIMKRALLRAHGRCERCGLALDVKTTIEMDTVRRFGDEFFMLLMKKS
jgi:hypothetical protein